MLSSDHLKLLDFISKNYSAHIVYHEYPCKKLHRKLSNSYDDQLLKMRTRKLRFDLYDKTFGLVIEMNGDQHYNYNPFFHGDRLDKFYDQVENDKYKKELCKRLGIKFLELRKFDEALIRSIYGR